jgi:hypothetical protein
MNKSVPTLYELASKKLQDAFIIRCESLLNDLDGFDCVPTPLEQQGCNIQHLIKDMKQNLQEAEKNALSCGMKEKCCHDDTAALKKRKLN